MQGPMAIEETVDLPARHTQNELQLAVMIIHQIESFFPQALADSIVIQIHNFAVPFLNIAGGCQLFLFVLSHDQIIGIGGGDSSVSDFDILKNCSGIYVL